MKIDGGCHCGDIAYEAEANPTKAMICTVLTVRLFRVRRFALLSSLRKVRSNLVQVSSVRLKLE